MYNHLTSAQRSQIFAYRQCDKSPKFIAEALNVHVSTIYRELSRNRNKRGGYAHNAHEMAMERQERIAKNATISNTTKFECLQHIRVDDWSPEQISGVMKKKRISVSHTTIYKWVKEDKLAGGTLFEHLRHKGHRRKENPYKSASARNIPNRTSIKNRPAEADGTRFGDWEMDLIIGKNGYQAILTLVERSTGYVIIFRLKHGKKAKELAEEVIRLLFAYRVEGVLTITTDNGSEFSQHQLITKALKGVVVYFADPYASWQKDLWSTLTNSYVNIFPKDLILTKLVLINLWIYRKNSITDLVKNLISQPQKSNSSNTFRNFALACLICDVATRFCGLQNILYICRLD